MQSYLVKAYENSGPCLYSRTLFDFISENLKGIKDEVRILDLGCADGRAERILKQKLAIKYFGIDIDPGFGPHYVADIKNVEECLKASPFEQDIILLTDVLEHLKEGETDIHDFLSKLSQHASPDSEIFITLPQMYRLDALKPSHLHYPEHKVRFQASEWISILSKYFHIKEITGVSYVSVLPYLIMFNRFYREDNILGKIFKFSRTALRGQRIFEFDSKLTKHLGKHPFFIPFSNSVLYRCQVRR
jgi:SAM-dependent methyltransferase